MQGELEKMYEMIGELETVMMTTRRPDGHLVSRAMSTQKRVDGADLWFVTREGYHKLDEIEHDPHVNLSYSKDGSREWVSVSGLATISRDRETIGRLYAPDWKLWFTEDGDERHGTPEDPRMVLVGVDIHSAVFLEVNNPQPVVLFELMNGWSLGTEPDPGTRHEVYP